VRIGRAAALTDTGRRRLENEDAFVLEPPLFAVADGMGGAQAGEVASRLAVSTIEERGLGLREEDALVELLQLANTRIFERSGSDPSVSGMGTTTTIVVVDEAGGTLTLAHVGDSRAYRIRGGAISQLTDDHSLVAELVRGGRLSEEEALVHPARSVITRVLGTDPVVEVDTAKDDVLSDDLVLLCSDGLSVMLRDETILELVLAADGPAEATEALVKAANAAGGDDNITVVLFEILDGDAPDRPDRPALAPPTPMSADETAESLSGKAATPATADVNRHGAGDGSRWPALLLLAAIALVAALALWWGLTR
jgi:serine/threonine protein phosphatase PrpC